MPEEVYSKPLAPPDEDFKSPSAASLQSARQLLTNADFRKLIQTPRGASTGADKRDDSSTSSSTFGHRAPRAHDAKEPAKDKRSSTSSGSRSVAAQKTVAHPGTPGPAFKPKSEEDELNDILKKYRDRARERREGEIRESEQELDLIKASGYKAVAPDAKGNFELAEKKKRLIEESKYLGGDMEHTHLVKGLDYALLQKVRSEILSKEKEEDDLERLYQSRKNERDQVELTIKLPFARNIYNALFKNDADTIEKVVNDLFAPRRMAYVMEMDDEFSADTDIPTTLIRSKQDCPANETSTNLSINDMVIQKLTQVLSYLRADNKKKKKDKSKISEEERAKIAGQGIYDEVGEYVPSLSKSSSKNADKTSSSSKDRNYFPKSSQDQKTESKSYDRKGTAETSSKHQSSSSSNSKSDKNQNGKIPAADQNTIKQPQKPAKPQSEEIFDSYAECYPGGMECYDAAGDSDDDADFSKMDLGNKKGPIRRWDFDTEQEYEEWMSRREAMPKAAFQYGVKMLDGRKTRKLPGPKSEKDEKAKIDRQWAKISKILDKRKIDGDEGIDSKRVKY